MNAQTALPEGASARCTAIGAHCPECGAWLNYGQTCAAHGVEAVAPVACLGHHEG